jgi:hypothetical protein
LYLFHIGYWKLAAIIFACSVSIKLIPLIFLPLFFQSFIKKEAENKKSSPFKSLGKLLIFFGIVLLILALSFIPFFNSELITNYANTVALWFQRFEFNASIYYIAREIGYAFRGFNEIALIGKAIPIMVICFILIITFFRKNRTTVGLITTMLLVLSFYYFMSTTVHPWYLTTLLILSIFTKYKFPLVWSFVIIFSYLAYTNPNHKENLCIIALEYLIVYGVLIWEIIIKKGYPNGSLI